MKKDHHTTNKGGKQQNKPLHKKDDVQKNPDKHIDQDFSGYPHSPSKDKTIRPGNKEEQSEANLHQQDKKPYTPKSEQGKGSRQKSIPAEDIDEQYSDGSANAFEASEE